MILGQNPPDNTPLDDPPPPDKTPHPHKTPRTQTTTAKPPRINPRSPTKHPEDKSLAKSKMAFILNSWLQSSIINMMNGKL